MLLLAIIAAASWLRNRRYRNVFRIATRRDDVFACRRAGHRYALAISAREFAVPDATLPAEPTAFLEIVVAVTIFGWWFDPFIEIGHDGISYRQYFERGARGRRLLNVSPALWGVAVRGKRVALRGRCIRWQPTAVLMVCEAVDAPPTQARPGETLVVTPHPDDAEIAAFGWYSQHPSWVVTITAGERSGSDLSTVGTPADERVATLARLRVWDSLHVPDMGGVSRSRCANLVFPDAMLQQMSREPDRQFSIACEPTLHRAALRDRNASGLLAVDAPCTWSALVEELRVLLEHIAPVTLIAPHPLLDASADHCHASLALAEALQKSSHLPQSVLLYVVHVNGVATYPLGDVHSALAPPPWSDGQWLADTIYCHPVSAVTRRAKAFAVEAQHDLRDYPDLRPRSWARLIVVLRREMVAFVTGLGMKPADFRRRAPRPHEMYYAVDVAGFVELAARCRR